MKIEQTLVCSFFYYKGFVPVNLKLTEDTKKINEILFGL